jgi:sn-glycerol 3-phosphate transport system permease protein
MNAGSRKKRYKDNVTAWLLIMPTLLIVGLFTFWPVVKALADSFYRNNLATPLPQFAGFENYRHLFEDSVFVKTLENSLGYALVTVPLSMIVALGLALLVHHSSKKIQPFLRLSWFYPTIVPLVAAANIWLFIYTPDYGLIDSVLGWFGFNARNWLGNPDTVMPSLVILYIWKQSGYFMIFFLAGLQQISSEYYEAARIDGAHSYVMFRHITFPLLMPTVLFVFIISFTAAFKTVDHLVIMTKGGPDNASNLLLYYIFETAFSFWDIGKAAAMTVILILLLLAVIIMSLGYFDRRIHYQG